MAFLTGILWLVFVGPLMILAYALGSQHAEASRLGTSVWRGLAESWRIAWHNVEEAALAADFAEKPADDVPVAVLYGVGVGLMPLLLFLGVAPQLRNLRGVIWVGGAGLLFGVAAYCQRRAAAYLIDPPEAWSFTRNWQRLSLSRYEPAGRIFVRVQILCTVLLPIWWLGGGIFAQAP